MKLIYDDASRLALLGGLCLACSCAGTSESTNSNATSTSTSTSTSASTSASTSTSSSPSTSAATESSGTDDSTATTSHDDSSGNDSNDVGGNADVGDTNDDPRLPCDLTIIPGDSFIEAFAMLAPGETLCLDDGVYTQEMDIPSDLNVRAVHDGKAEIDGMGMLGVEWGGGIVQMIGDNSSVRGLKVHHATMNGHACAIAGNNNTMRHMSCSHGGLYKHAIPLFVGGSGHLIEDSWAYGEGRYIFQCFIGTDITFRRNVGRWDSTAPNEPDEPNAAFAIYNCANITIENNISLDYGAPETPMAYGGDFYSPQNVNVWPEGNHDNHYLGNFAVNHRPGNNNRRGLRLDPDGAAQNNVVADMYVRSSDLGISGSKGVTDLTLGNCTLIDVDNPGSIAGDPVSCSMPADTQFRYIDGVKTDMPLFPWPQEDLIYADLCAPEERQSDWCMSGKSLGDYVLGL